MSGNGEKSKTVQEMKSFMSNMTPLVEILKQVAEAQKEQYVLHQQHQVNIQSIMKLVDTIGDSVESLCRSVQVLESKLSSEVIEGYSSGEELFEDHSERKQIENYQGDESFKECYSSNCEDLSKHLYQMTDETFKNLTSDEILEFLPVIDGELENYRQRIPIESLIFLFNMFQSFPDIMRVYPKFKRTLQKRFNELVESVELDEEWESMLSLIYEKLN